VERDIKKHQLFDQSKMAPMLEKQRFILTRMVKEKTDALDKLNVTLKKGKEENEELKKHAEACGC
jgi:hypothetical protein